MPDSIIDDVNALLEGGYGDDRILRQIHRACENGEAISNYERNYVRDLAERHAGRAGAPPPGDLPVPDVEIPAPQAAPPDAAPAAAIPAPGPRAVGRRAKRRRPAFRAILVVAVALAVIAPAAAFLGSYEPPAAPAAETYVRTDKASYGANEVIAIYGLSGGSGSITVSITNGDGKTEWSYEADIKDRLSENPGGYRSNYSTLTAADPAWEGSGTFTVTADDGITIESSTFSFAR